MLKHIPDNDLKSIAETGVRLTAEQETNCKVIYRETDGGYVFEGFYNPDIPDEEYPDGLAAFSLRSSFNQCVPIAGGTQIFNVVGSNKDVYKDPLPPDISKTWLNVWQVNVINYDADLDRTQPLPNGALHNNHTLQSYATGPNLPQNLTDIIGGHVVTNQNLQDAPIGSNVYLVPIYRSFNSAGRNRQMNVIAGGVVAVELKGFKQ